jgi:NAD(P)-dependent dehydrogenase (short-subunit alcohol dehydrogenase family)
MKLKDQVAIITGAGRNIGEETSKLLASEGAKVAVVDMDKGRGEKVASAIKAAGGTAAAFVANIASEADVQKLIKDVVGQWGRVDILVNNAAISDNKHILEISKEDWDKVIGVTLTGPFLMSKYAAQQMVAQGGGGKIVNVGSTSGFRGRPRAIAYTAAKGGVANLTRSLAVQLAPHNIRVNCVVPNKIGSPVGKDEFDPTRPIYNLRNRPGVPIDLAKAVLFLVSDDSDFVVGDMLFVDGGAMAILDAG